MDIKGAFTVRFIRTGDQIYKDASIVKFDKNGNETPGSLFQAVDPTNGTLNVDWEKDPYSQPALKIGLNSAMDNPLTITDADWQYNGADISFAVAAQTDGTYKGWRLSTDGRFARKETSSYVYLRVLKNIASTEVVSNQQIGYTISYMTNNIHDKIKGTEPVLIQQAGANSYSVNILTSRSILNADNPQTTLAARYLYNVTAIPDEEFNASWRLQWYQDFKAIDGQTGKTLTVTRDMVKGSSIFSVELQHKEGDNWVKKAVDAQRISDESDEWQFDASPYGNGTDALSKNNEAKYALTLKQNGKPTNATWLADVYNAINVKTASNLTTTKGTNGEDVLTLKPEYALCTPEEGTQYNADISVELTAAVA